MPLLILNVPPNLFVINDAIIYWKLYLTLLKINALDIVGLSISAFGIFMSLISNIVSILEK